MYVFSAACNIETADVSLECIQTTLDASVAKIPDILAGYVVEDQVQTKIPSEESVGDSMMESVLGVKKPMLTALQRRKKKVKESASLSRTTISSHLIDDEIDD